MSEHFDKAAASWDQDEQKVRMAESIAESMIRNLSLKSDQVLLDYGTGTGLIALQLLPYVKQVLAVDVSQGMLAALQEKIARKKLANVAVLKISPEAGMVDLPAADVIVSSMTLHHIQDTVAAIKAFWATLKPGGQIAIADLDEDNGEFHAEPDSVRHNGFNRRALEGIFVGAGFSEIKFYEVYQRRKCLDDGKERVFTIFLLTAKK